MAPKPKIMKTPTLIQTDTSWINPKRNENIHHTVDDVCDAWLSGVDTGEKKFRKKIEAAYNANINKTSSHAMQILGFFKNEKIKVKNIFLKVNSFSNFTIMFVVPEKYFLSDNVLPVYRNISKFKAENNNDEYYLDVVICPKSRNLNEQYIFSDGFLFEHKQ